MACFQTTNIKVHLTSSAFDCILLVCNMTTFQSFAGPTPTESTKPCKCIVLIFFALDDVTEYRSLLIGVSQHFNCKVILNRLQCDVYYSTHLFDEQALQS